MCCYAKREFGSQITYQVALLAIRSQGSNPIALELNSEFNSLTHSSLSRRQGEILTKRFELFSRLSMPFDRLFTAASSLCSTHCRMAASKPTFQATNFLIFIQHHS
jgi:hypothetical protein